MIAYLLSISLLICAVVLIRGVFRKTVSPRVIYALWLTVAVRMILPISLFEADVALPEFLRGDDAVAAKPISAEKATDDERVESPALSLVVTSPEYTPKEPIVYIPNDVIAEASDSLSVNEYSDVTAKSEQAIHITSETEASSPEVQTEAVYGEHEVSESTASFNIKEIADLVWLCGAVIAAVWMLMTGIGYARRLKKGRYLYKTVCGTKVYVSDNAGVPCIVGLLPSIYITPEAVNSGSEALIIEHERVHIRHGDHIWAAVRMLALAVFWWNPFVWVAAALSKRDAELACDDAIVSKLDEDGRLKYARILIDTIPRKHSYAVSFGSAPMKERILMLTKERKKHVVCLILAAVLAAGAVACAFVDVNEKPNEEISNEETNAETTIDETESEEESGEHSPIFDENLPVIDIHINDLKDEMEHIEENELYVAEKYVINVKGMSVPAALYMQLDSVAAIEAHGHYVEIKELFDIYGNCSFELFEADGAVIIEGGYYKIGDIYIISPEGCREIHRGIGSSYWLYLDDNGSLRYQHNHNGMANIMQTGALSVAAAYDEFLFASGDASIKNGELYLAEPTESYTMSDRYDPDEEFKTHYASRYGSIEEKFAENLAMRNVEKYGQGPFIGYVADKDTPWIDLYTSKTGTYVGRIPYEIFHDWAATDRNSERWTPGWQPEYVHFYYVEFGDFCWAAAHLTDTAMGNGRKNVATSSDCGKAWSVGSTMDDYGGNHVIGMYFVSDKIAFMRFDPNNSHTIPDGPEISQTLDGGKTWQRLAVSVPDSLKGKKLIAGAPTHMGDVIIFPVWHNPAHGSIEGDAVYLVSRDNGITWAWEDDLERSYPSFEEILDAVLENRMPVTFASSGNTRSLSEFSSVMGLSVTKYSVLDLDGDSRSEAVLWISRGADEYYGFLVLHRDGDTVYAHEFTYRGFNGLKADGTYHASSSAFNSSVRKLAFDGGTCSVIILAHRDGDKTSEPVVYTVNGRIASADEFDAFFAEYENKPDAVWYDYIAE